MKAVLSKLLVDVNDGSKMAGSRPLVVAVAQVLTSCPNDVALGVGTHAMLLINKAQTLEKAVSKVKLIF